MTSPPPRPLRAVPSAPPTTGAPRPDERRPRSERWTSGALFGGSIEIEIEHAGAVYRLRQTSLGKLILTK